MLIGFIMVEQQYKAMMNVQRSRDNELNRLLSQLPQPWVHRYRLLVHHQ